MSFRVGKTTTEPHINTWTDTLTEQRDPQYWEKPFDQFRMTAGDSIAINASIILPGLRSVRARFHPNELGRSSRNPFSAHTNTCPKDDVAARSARVHRFTSAAYNSSVSRAMALQLNSSSARLRPALPNFSRNCRSCIS